MDGARQSRTETGSEAASLRWVAYIALAAFCVIATAWAFEIFGGLKPCPLCLKQRTAYYFGIPAALAILALFRDLRRGPGALLLTFIGIAFAANAVLAAYHAGVEWQLWAGPSSCSGGAGPMDLAAGAGNLLEAIQSERVIRCDQAPWQFLGLSFAGWNVIISFTLAAAAFAVLRREFGANR